MYAGCPYFRMSLIRGSYKEEELLLFSYGGFATFIYIYITQVLLERV